MITTTQAGIKYSCIDNLESCDRINFPISEELLAKLELEAFKSGAEFAEEWISVDTELPTLGKFVLIKDSEGQWDKGELIHLSGDSMWASSSGDIGQVIEWRPIDKNN